MGGLEAALAAGAAVDARDADSCTALHWAADKGHVQVHRSFTCVQVLECLQKHKDKLSASERHDLVHFNIKLDCAYMLLSLEGSEGQGA